MKITYLLIFSYIFHCVRMATYPYKVFQLNSRYFNHKRGIFSKISIDERIPDQWRLPQRYDSDEYTPEVWPVFFKPEWGQNASGVSRVDNVEQLKVLRQKTSIENIRYLIQQSATGTREFEIFSIRHHKDQTRPAVFTITEVINNSDTRPVNSVKNTNTRYVEITQKFSTAELEILWKMINQFGQYNISRASLSANSIENLLNGNFKVIEINLFLPMPINLLDQKQSVQSLFTTVQQYMICLAKITRYRDKSYEHPVFIKMMMYNRKSKLINYLRTKL